jgi:hypothetical protein
MPSQVFEVWCSEPSSLASFSTGVPYVVLLMPAEDGPGFVVIDPVQGYRVVEKAADYDSAIRHLEQECDFHRVGPPLATG